MKSRLRPAAPIPTDRSLRLQIIARAWFFLSLLVGNVTALPVPGATFRARPFMVPARSFSWSANTACAGSRKRAPTLVRRQRNLRRADSTVNGAGTPFGYNAVLRVTLPGRSPLDAACYRVSVPFHYGR